MTAHPRPRSAVARARHNALLTSLLVVAAVGCSSSSRDRATGTPGAVYTTDGAQRVIAVVAAENFWGDITRQIGGDHVRVTSIISDPNADPHTYETDPRDAAAVNAARFVVLNGAGYDDFASKLLAASPSAARTVISIARAVGVSGADPNPHLWYDPAYVTAAAQAIEAALATADRADNAGFQANLTGFLASYRPYLDIIAAIRARHLGDRVAFTERVPGYLVKAAGLVLGTPASFAQSIEDGNDPSPADTIAMDAAMKDHSVKVLLYNAQVTSPVTDKVKALATANGVPIVGVSETIPAGDANFQSWQIAQASAILTALGG